MHLRLLTCAPFLLALSVTLYATALTPEANSAFDRYVALTEQRHADELTRTTSFLWIDTLSSSVRSEVQRELHEGAVIVERLETRDGSTRIGARHALIHHWVGIVFVPGASLGSAVAMMQDYDSHSRIFAPAIAASKTLERNGSHFKVALRFYVKKVIAVTLDTENEADFFRPAPTQAYSRIRSTRVTEIADAGTPQERPKAAGQENGFMYRLNTYWRFLERDGGTYIQCESLTLSRDIPFAFRWIIKPFVTGMPKESLAFTLQKARQALTSAGRD